MKLEEKLHHLKAWYTKKRELVLRYFSLPFFKKNQPYMVYKGDIYLADLGINIGSETDKTRPVVVFQSQQKVVRSLQTVFIFPITSNIKPYRYKLYFTESKNNSKCTEGCIIVSQGRTISKMRLKKYWGKFSKENIQKIEQEFLRFLEIKKSPPNVNIGEAHSQEIKSPRE